MEDKPLQPHMQPQAHGAADETAGSGAQAGAAVRYSSPRLPHESLHAYQAAREVVAFVAKRRARLRELPGDLADHAERAAVSALLNTAEASGRSAPRDRKSRFAIARGEACEVAAALDAAHLFGAISAGELAAVRDPLARLCQMLGKLAS